LQIKETNLAASQKMLDMLLHAKKGFPELLRSEMMAEIKEQHRKIEKNTNPNTKSQNN
jgi:hypothetical protein